MCEVQVLLTSNADNQVLVKVLMRSTRRPEIGDKFSRSGRGQYDVDVGVRQL